MGWIPSSCYDVHRSLWILSRREGDFSPLAKVYHHFLQETCPSRKLSTQRIRHCGLNVTFQIPSQQCANALSRHFWINSHDVPAVERSARNIGGQKIRLGHQVL